ncbi:MAG: porin [Saprospiraceae bacterium]
MKTSLPHKIRLLSGLVLLAVATSVWSQTEVSQEDHSYKPLTLKLNETGSKYVRFIIWHQQWAVTNNLAIDDAKFQVSTMARRSRFLAYAQVSSRFLLLMHFGLNNLSPTNLDGLGNGGNGPQFFLHDAWTEFKVVPKSLYIGTGLHYWKGLTRLASQSTLNFMTMDNPRPFAPWHSLGVTDQFARHLGVYIKGELGKLDYRVAVNNPLNPANALGAGKDFGNHSSGLTYNGSAKADENGDPVGNTIIEGYFRYNLLDAESTVLPFNVGSYLGTKKVFALGAGFFLHPNAMYRESDKTHENVSHFAADAFYDAPVSGGDCLNAYAAFTHFNYGKNYLSRWAGTGNNFYGQLGYKLKNTSFMPYIAYQYADYEGYDEAITGLDIGLNYFINAHHAKITLEYHQVKGDYRDVPAAVQADGINRQFRLQTHIFL